MARKKLKIPIAKSQKNVWHYDKPSEDKYISEKRKFAKCFWFSSAGRLVSVGGGRDH